MNNQSKKFRLLIITLIIVSITMTGCAGSSTQVLAGSSWPSGVVADGVAYISYGSQLYAVEAGDMGADVLWAFPAEPQQKMAMYARPAIDGTTLVVGDYYGTIWALNTENGQEIWSLKTGEAKYIGGPSILDGIAYIGDSDGTIHAVDIESGVETWSFSAEKGIWGTPLATPDGIFFTSLDSHVYSVSPADGSLLWTFPREEQSVEPAVAAMIGEPVIFGDTMLVSSLNNHLYAIDLASQEVLWTYETGNWMWGYPVQDEVTGNVIGADLDGNVFALDLETGEEVWTTLASGRIVASPVISELDGEPVILITSDIEQGDKNLLILNTSDGSPATSAISVTSEFTTRFLFVQTGVDSRAVPLLAEPILLDNRIILIGTQGDMPLFFMDGESLRIDYRCNPTTGACAS